VQHKVFTMRYYIGYEGTIEKKKKTHRVLI